MTDNTPATERKPALIGPFKHRWSNTLYRWISVAIGVAAVVVFALIVIGKLLESAELPDCDSQAAWDTLSDVLKTNNVSASSYNYRKTVSKTDDEVKCTASLALREGGNLEVDYRFYWNNKAKQYEITRWQPARD